MIRTFRFDEFGLEALKATEAEKVKMLLQKAFYSTVSVVEITSEDITLESDVMTDERFELFIREFDEQLMNFLQTWDYKKFARILTAMDMGLTALKANENKPSEVDDNFTVDIKNDGSGAIVISAKLADMPAMGDAVTKVAILNKVFSGNCYYFSLNKKGTKLKMLCEEREDNWSLFFGAINTCFSKENPEQFLEIMAKIEASKQK